MAAASDLASEAPGKVLSTVDVLLATYNGAKFLPAQLDSLLAQTHQDFHLLVSDDGSSDDTLEILHRYRSRFAGRMSILTYPGAGAGVIRNFEHLMKASLERAEAGLVAFCDQDDVWLPHKLQVLVTEMHRMQRRSGFLQEPCMVHSDLAVVDDGLATIHPSFASHQRFDPARCSTTTLLSMNQVTGCAMMINRALLELALPLPAAAVMHDWWCALLGSGGRCFFVDEPLVLYRQHGGNQLGARSRTLRSRLMRVWRNAPGVLERVRTLGRGTAAQAEALEIRQRESGQCAAAVSGYRRWRARPLWWRMLSYRRYYVGPELDRISRLLLWRAG